MMFLISMVFSIIIGMLSGYFWARRMNKKIPYMGDILVGGDKKPTFMFENDFLERIKLEKEVRFRVLPFENESVREEN